MRNRKRLSTSKLVLLSMFVAIAYVIVMAVRIPVFMFLSYEPKDVVITVAGFLFGGIPAAVVSLIVSLVEMFTISDTGPIGALMNFLSTVSFACTAAFIYKKNHTRAGALLGLVAGTVAMTAVMLLWNWVVTPFYMGVDRSAVEAMLVPVFLPFNLLKAGLNSAITMLIYKPLVIGLRKTGMLPPGQVQPGSGKVFFYVLAGLLLAACILLLLFLQGIL